MLAFDLPSGSIFDIGVTEYVTLLISATDITLDNPYYWAEADRDTAAGYIEDLKIWLMEILPNMTSASFPVGCVADLALSTVPSGWLECDGSAVSRTTYAMLFAAIGTTFGVGDGTTTFNLPDARGRTVIGAGQGSGLTNRTLGASLGVETHALSVAEMPIHSHDVTLKPSGGSNPKNITQTTIGAGSDITKATSTQGSGDGHQNMQPSLVLKKIIYAGV